MRDIAVLEKVSLGLGVVAQAVHLAGLGLETGVNFETPMHTDIHMVESNTFDKLGVK